VAAVPGHLAGIHDIRQTAKYRVGEPAAAQIVPDRLDRIELRAIKPAPAQAVGGSSNKVILPGTTSPWLRCQPASSRIFLLDEMLPAIRLPVTSDTCEVIEERWANWLRHDPVVAIETQANNLRRLKALYIDEMKCPALGDDGPRDREILQE